MRVLMLAGMMLCGAQAVHAHGEGCPPDAGARVDAQTREAHARAMAAYREGEVEQAIRILSIHLEGDPCRQDLWLNLGDAYRGAAVWAYEQGKTVEAGGHPDVPDGEVWGASAGGMDIPPIPGTGKGGVQGAGHTAQRATDAGQAGETAQGATSKVSQEREGTKEQIAEEDPGPTQGAPPATVQEKPKAPAEEMLRPPKVAETPRELVEVKIPQPQETMEPKNGVEAEKGKAKPGAVAGLPAKAPVQDAQAEKKEGECKEAGPWTGLPPHKAKQWVEANGTEVEELILQSGAPRWRVWSKYEADYRVLKEYAQSLKALGVEDLWLAPEGVGPGRVALGVYTRARNAARRKESLEKLGVEGVLLLRPTRVTGLQWRPTGSGEGWQSGWGEPPRACGERAQAPVPLA